MDMRFRWQIKTVPDNLVHKTRYEEICELVNYLELISTAADPCMMMYKSEGLPPIQMRGHIWAKVDQNGAPIGLFAYHSGEWQCIASPTGAGGTSAVADSRYPPWADPVAVESSAPPIVQEPIPDLPAEPQLPGIVTELWNPQNLS